MNCDYTGPNYSPEDLRSVIDAMCKSLESSGQIDEHEHPSAYSTLLDTAKWMAELEGQEPIKKAERDTLAAKLKDAEHDRDEFRRVMNGFAEKMAELEGQEPVAWVEVVSTHEGPYNFEGMALLGKGNHLLYARPVPAEMSPDWVLWHHQGGSSPVGQPIRYALGMDAHEHLSKHQVQEAKRWAALTKSESNDFRQARTAPPEPVNARLLEALIQCRDRFLFYVEHHLANGAAVKAAENDRFVTLANQAIAAAEAQQDRLLQDMHDAGREIDRVMADPAPKAARLTDEEIASLLAASDKNSPRVPSFFMTEPHKFARAIETAAIRKNGIEVAE